MASNVNINGTWRNGNTTWSNINGVWRTGREYSNINGTWRVPSIGGRFLIHSMSGSGTGYTRDSGNVQSNISTTVSQMGWAMLEIGLTSRPAQVILSLDPLPNISYPANMRVQSTWISNESFSRISASKGNSLAASSIAISGVQKPHTESYVNMTTGPGTWFGVRLDKSDTPTGYDASGGYLYILNIWVNDIPMQIG